MKWADTILFDRPLRDVCLLTGAPGQDCGINLVDKPRLIALATAADALALRREYRQIVSPDRITRLFFAWRLASLAHDRPIHLLRSASLRGKRQAFPLRHRRLRRRDQKLRARLHEWSDQRLQRFLILKLQSYPVRCPRHL